MGVFDGHGVAVWPKVHPTRVPVSQNLVIIPRDKSEKRTNGRKTLFTKGIIDIINIRYKFYNRSHSHLIAGYYDLLVGFGRSPD